MDLEEYIKDICKYRAQAISFAKAKWKEYDQDDVAMMLENWLDSERRQSLESFAEQWYVRMTAKPLQYASFKYDLGNFGTVDRNIRLTIQMYGLDHAAQKFGEEIRKAYETD